MTDHPKIMHNGILVHTTNSNGHLIHSTEEGIYNFHNWFGNSKAVDKHGRPLVLYHGTGADFDTFNPELSGTNTGKHLVPKSTFVFSTSPNVASTYTIKRLDIFNDPQYKEGGNVKPVYLKTKKQLVVDAKGYNWDDIMYKKDLVQTNDIFDEAKRKGYDSAKITNVYDAHKGKSDKSSVYAIFNPSNVKSAIGNSGAFSNASDKIHESLDSTLSMTKVPEDSMLHQMGSFSASMMGGTNFAMHKLDSAGYMIQFDKDGATELHHVDDNLTGGYLKANQPSLKMISTYRKHIKGLIDSGKTVRIVAHHVLADSFHRLSKNIVKRTPEYKVSEPTESEHEFTGDKLKSWTISK